MGYPRKNSPMNVMEMVEMVDEMRESNQNTKNRRNNLYKAQSGDYQHEQLQLVLQDKLDDLKMLDLTEPVNLRDAAELKRRAEVYISVCQCRSAFPSILGYSRALGVSYRALRKHIERNPNDAGSRFLLIFSEMVAEVLHESALANNANSILSIFLSKAIYDISDTAKIELVNGKADDEGNEIDLDEIRERYAKYTDIDYEEIEK